MLEFLGGHHLDRATFPTATDNMLDILAGAPLGGVGFTMPLGPGAYTINVQQTGTPLTAYELDIVVTPAPGAAAAMVVLAGLAGGRRRTRD
jgi:MYXO-CTERM domain-containing protein